MQKSWSWGALVAALSLGVLAACGGGDGDEPTPVGLTVQKIGGYTSPLGKSATPPGTVTAQEIPAFDALTKRAFIVNASLNTVDVLDLSDPTKPVLAGVIDVSALGASANSVAVSDGLVAVAIEKNPKTDPGVVAFYNASTLQLITSVTVGALPDMLTFTPDGKRVLVANEGEPSGYGTPPAGTSYADPEGSISVITVNRSGSGSTLAVAPVVATADFKAFIGKEDELRAQGVRIYGPGANAAQDLEPEYITVSADSKTAYVTLQENNAIAVVDVATARVTAIKPLGFKDHNIAGAGLDASDEDGGTDTNSGTAKVDIVPRPVKGLYLPDAIANYTVDGITYLITANEGDARADWPGFNEETRVRAHCSAGGLDPSVFGANAAKLLFDSALGRLRITTTPNGGDTGKNAAGQCTALYSFGGRSISIWKASDVSRVFDSGDDLEQRTKALTEAKFNASHDNDTLDARSSNKGPEPEGVVVAQFGNRSFAFVALERIGGVAVYDVSKPAAATFVTYLNTRSGATGDRGPEGMAFVPASKSPNGKPLLIVGNEESGTTTVLQINLTY